MPPVGFEPTISAGEQPQTYALDRAALGPTIKPYIIIIAGWVGARAGLDRMLQVQLSLCRP